MGCNKIEKKQHGTCTTDNNDYYSGLQSLSTWSVIYTNKQPCPESQSSNFE